MKYLIVLSLMLTACRGPQGDRGPIGQTGPGPQINIPPTVTWVQFCPGTPSYPTTFPEGGFCLNGNVYAVYSANDGFMTMIPPGTYNSNAVGSSCTFTLLDDCVIQ